MLPKCSICGKVLDGEYINHDRHNYHKSCFEKHIALKCTLCDKIIQGKYIKDYWGNLYHQAHTRMYPTCAYCARLIEKTITGGGVTLKDGRQICHLCRRTSVYNIQEANTLLAQTHAQLAHFGIKIEYKYPLALVDTATLAQVSGKKNPDHQGFTRREVRFLNDRVTSFKIEVFILESLPQMHYIATCAHELMHVWQYLKVKAHLPADINEGSCNYAAYLVLSQLKSKEAEYIIYSMEKSQKKIYGKGFRKIYDLVKKHGVAYWLKYLQM